MPALTYAVPLDRSKAVPVPSAAVALAHRLVTVAVLASIPVVVITLDILAGGPLRHLDEALATGGWHRSDAAMVHLGYAVDRLGQRAVAGAVLVAVAAVLGWRRRSWQPLVVTGVALAALNVVVGAMKLGIGRTKPLSGVDLLYAGGSQFPSGHAANAVLSWGLLSYLLLAYGARARRPVVVRLLVGAPVVLSVAVCATSLYLDYHWLSDLVAGAAMGVLLLALVLAWDVTRMVPVRQVTLARRDGAAGMVSGPVLAARPPV